jgi:hypothetical protein
MCAVSRWRSAADRGRGWKFLPELDGWEVVDNHHLKKSYRFSNFRESQEFVNRVGDLAEEQGTSSGYLFRVGKRGYHDLDAQDRWSN